MGNKTISLDDICEGILKEMQKREHFDSFSAWIRAKMIEEYNSGQPKITGTLHRQGLPSRGYICPNCKVDGHHWEERCPFPTKQEQINKLRMRASRGEEE